MTITATANYIETLPNGLSFEMVKVEGGTFLMGSERFRSEQPVHKVTVPGFWIGKFPVTQEFWGAIMGENPSRFKGNTNPVERVSWNDTQLFLQKLNELTKADHRLPTEAEWEYAARGGNQSMGFLCSGGNRLKEVGWYRVNSHGETNPVGLKLPNELDLFDMSGNVWEWCADHWHENYNNAPKDGQAWLTGGDKDLRVVRGGSWGGNGGNCSVSLRYRNDADNRGSSIGFRVARY